MATHSIGVSSRNLNNMHTHHLHHNSSSNNSTSSNSGVGLVTRGNKMMKPSAWSARDANLSSSRPSSTMVPYNITTGGAAHYNIHTLRDEEEQEQLKINFNSRLQQENVHHVTPQNVHHENVHLVSRHLPKSRYHHAHHQGAVISARTSGHLNGHHLQRASSPSATTITSSDDREEVPMVRHQRRSHHGGTHGDRSDRRSVISRVSRPGSYLPASAGGGAGVTSYDIYTTPAHTMMTSNGRSTAIASALQGHPHPFNTLRSAKSVPSLPYPGMADQSTGGPGCPVHHHGEPLQLQSPSHLPFVYAHHPPTHTAAPSEIHNATLMRRVGSVVDLRSLAPSGMHTLSQPGHPTAYSVVNFDTGKKSYRHFTHLPMPQLPPGMTFNHHHPSMMMQHATLNRCNSKHLTGKQMNDAYVDEGTACCKGHLIVLWIILTVVTLGVISGIVLAVTMN